MVVRERIELSSYDYKSHALTTELTDMVAVVELESTLNGF